MHRRSKIELIQRLGLRCVTFSIKFADREDQRNHYKPRYISPKENGLVRIAYHCVYLALQHG